MNLPSLPATSTTARLGPALDSKSREARIPVSGTGAEASIHHGPPPCAYCGNPAEPAMRICRACHAFEEAS